MCSMHKQILFPTSSENLLHNLIEFKIMNRIFQIHLQCATNYPANIAKTLLCCDSECRDAYLQHYVQQKLIMHTHFILFLTERKCLLYLLKKVIFRWTACSGRKMVTTCGLDPYIDPLLLFVSITLNVMAPCVRIWPVNGEESAFSLPDSC